MNKTVRAVERQIRATGCPIFEVGLFNPAAEGTGPVMIPRVWDSATLLRSVGWLRIQNREGRNVFCRPKGEHCLSLIDDLTPNAITEMKRAGFEPALLVETSPNNFQAWLNHGRVLPPALSTAVAKALARNFGGDSGAADWRHFGRLAGFTNRKPKYRDPENGLYPFVHLVEWRGAPYRSADSFLDAVGRELAEARLRDSSRSGAISHTYRDRALYLKNIDEFRNNSRYDGDGTRVDLAYAIYAISHGLSVEQVDSAIRSRDLSHKGSDKRQNDYVDRTIRKALAAAEGKRRER